VRYLLLALLACSATAGTINITFEAPLYSPGNINGQDGWMKTGPYDVVVTSAAAYEGAQSLRMSNDVGSSSFGDHAFTPHLDIPAGESSIPGAYNTFLSSWYFKSVTGQLQPGLGITVSADAGTGTRTTYLRMQDDAVNGMNLLFVDVSGSPESFVYHELATNLDRSIWHRIDMNIYFHDGPGNDLVQIFLDGSMLIEGTTWEDDARTYPPVGNVPPVTSLMFRAGGAAAPATSGQGFYIDNVSLESLDTPEPGTLGLALAGVIGLLLRRIPRS
jgi:hypothetical protein